MTFEFATAGRIVFGRGTSQQIPTLAADLGRRPCWCWDGAAADARR